MVTTMSTHRQELEAIDHHVMNGVVGGAGTALSQLAAACPTLESYDTSPKCKAADTHYVAVIQRITRGPRKSQR